MSLEELRPSLCVKAHGDYHACLADCPGFSRCRAGQRVAALVYGTRNAVPAPTDPTPPERPERGDRALLRAACESGNAWHYLMTTRHLSRDAARELLGRLIRENPGIASEYGGSRRIIQRPKVVSITPIRADEPQPVTAPPEPPNPEPPEPPKAKPTEPPQPASASQKRLRGPEKLMVMARERFLRAIASGDPIAWVMKTYGTNYRTAVQRVRQWCTSYADIVEANGGKEKIFYAHLKSAEKGVDMSKPEEAAVIPEKKAAAASAKDDGDEISLVDFLGTYGAGRQTTDAERKRFYPATVVPAKKEPGKSAEKMDLSFVRMLTLKYMELAKERETLIKEIRIAQERQECIEKQLTKLAECTQLFNPEMSITNQCG